MKMMRMRNLCCVCAVCGSVLSGVSAFAAGGRSDAEKFASTEMNAAHAETSTDVGGGVRIVFIGNSITLHGSLPKIGWTNNWGMAASAAEKDYVHLVTRGIEKRTGRAASVKVRNLAAFERNYRTYDIGRSLADLVAFDPDYLVVALGENAPSLDAKEDETAYRQAFHALLKAFLSGTRRPRTAVRGVFWPNAAKDRAMSAVAVEFGVPFVRTDFSDDPSMRAVGLFEHKGVANHPGDKGMAETARRILSALLDDRIP